MTMQDPARYYYGFSFDRLGDDGFSFEVDDDGNGDTWISTFTTGHYYHALDDTGGTPAGFHASFAAALQTKLNADAITAGATSVWTVTWDNAALSYRISEATFGGAWAANLNTVASNVLGMVATVDTTGAPDTSLHDSDVQPYYVIAPQEPGIAWKKPIREEKGFFSEGVTDAGQAIIVGPTTLAKVFEWKQQYESRAASDKVAAVAAVPWTWEHSFQHARDANEPIVLVSSESASISYGASDVVMRVQLRADGVHYAPDLYNTRIDAERDIPFRVRVVEQLQ